MQPFRRERIPEKGENLPMLFGKQYQKEGAGLPLPEGGIRRYGALLTSHFWKLVELNLLFVLFSLPVVTLPAALCGMNRVCMLLIRNGYCFLWEEFWQEFRQSLRRSLLPAALFTLLLLAGYYFMSLGLTNAALPAWSMLFWAVGMAAAAAGICWGSYFFALLRLLEQKTALVLKNAWLLCMVNPLRSFAVLAIILAAGVFLAFLMLISVVLLLTCAVALVQFSVCFVVYGLAKRYILIEEE